MALLVVLAAVVVVAIVGAPRSSAGPTVTGKHHVAGHVTCSADNKCVWVSPTWQLDVLYRLKSADTINVDKATYDRYDVGDDFRP
ncbi:hypothetical protein [Leifsonia poae]|uniref:hypothetical protein n=1 Tax=Leifsonia poae TaxID=110933 RepID=UPI003D6753FB